MQSAIKYRPRSFNELIGQNKLIKLLRGQHKAKTLSNALMFTGPKGSGKTTIAGILATSFQCIHQKFGHPCLECRKAYRAGQLPIYEINCGKIRKVEQLETFIYRADYDIVGKGKNKVFILDEAHRLSDIAQDVLLIPTEPKNSQNIIWIINTTREDKIIGTLRSRFQIYNMHTLSREEIVELVKVLLQKHKSELNAEDLADALVDNTITSGRLIANAVDKYIGGASAEDAALVEGNTKVNGKAITAALRKGMWADVASLLQKVSPGDVKLLRFSIAKFLRVVLLDSSELNDKNKTLAQAVKNLSYVGFTEDSNQFNALVAELYTLCDLFSEYNQ